MKAHVLQEWARHRGFTIIKPTMRHPALLKVGSIGIRPSVFALIIPLPYEDCEVHYQPSTGDRRRIAWLDPVLLPEKSVLFLVKGQMKFLILEVEYKVVEGATLGDASRAGGVDVGKEGGGLSMEKGN